MKKFDNSSRVCFLGDSIVASGIWIAKIIEYYRNLGIDARFYNLGVAGNTAVLEWEYLEKEPFLRDATDVVMLFGMNDIGRSLYESGGHEEEKKIKIEQSKNALDKIVSELLNQGKALVLCSSTPHAENCEINDALCEIGLKMKEIATKNAGVSFIDLHKLFMGASLPLIDDDTVHPSLMGNAVIANTFLSFQGFSDVYTGGDISVWEKEMNFPMTEDNKARFKVEAMLRSIEFVKRIVLPVTDDLDEYYKTCDAFFRKQINVYKRSNADESDLIKKLKLLTEK